MWRQHSWIVTETGIIETTVPRDEYFGFALSGQAQEAFIRANE